MLTAQTSVPHALSPKQQSIVTISALTATGNTGTLLKALHKGLDDGLTVNEIKEELVQLYAYCGFPRSLNGLNVFMAVLDERRKKGIRDKLGKAATPVTGSESKYERGKKVLAVLTGKEEIESKTGYGAFSPEIDVFLKEHLFADIFSRDVLTYSERELTTIAALASMTGLESQLQAHMRIGMNVGFTESQLMQLLSLIESTISPQQADAGRNVLASVLVFMDK